MSTDSSERSGLNVEGVIRRPISFQSGDETLAGDLVLPTTPGPYPAILAVAGTGSQNRYGDMVLPDGTVKPHGRYIWIASRLAQAGIASLYWDKRGVGQSTGGNRQAGEGPGERDSYTSVMTDVQDAESALNFLAAQPEIDASKIAVMGRSAGVYFSCLLAERTNLPAAYILTAGLYTGIDDFMDLIYENVLEYAGRSQANKVWVKENLKAFYGLARHWRNIVEAAHQGDDVYQHIEEDGEVVRQYLTRLKQELDLPLYDQFRHLNKPVLITHGTKDVNVPLEDAYKIAAKLEALGHPDYTLAIIPGADHSFTIAPPSLDDEARFRYKFASKFRYPNSEFFIHTVIGWTLDQFKYLQV